MNIRKLNKKNVPIVRIDKRLDRVSKKVLFPVKVDEANRMLKEIGLPLS
jgi:hypothetical protein